MNSTKIIQSLLSPAQAVMQCAKSGGAAKKFQIKSPVRSTIFITILACGVFLYISFNHVPLLEQPFASSLPSSRFCDRGDSIKCVFGIGHNTGQDTRYYLSVKPPVRVVAVDANPTLINESSHEFKPFIDKARLKLLNVGLTPHAGDLTFWVNHASDKFSSFNEAAGCRGPYGVQMGGSRQYCHPISVSSRTCASLVHEFGLAEYIKIDIESRSYGCVESILSELYAHERPRYMSVENVTPEFLNLFRKYDYRWFKAVDQLALQQGVVKSLDGWSGPWGENAVDVEYGTRWLTFDKMMARVPLARTKFENGKNKTMWYDLHAKLF